MKVDIERNGKTVFVRDAAVRGGDEGVLLILIETSEEFPSAVYKDEGDQENPLVIFKEVGDERIKLYLGKKKADQSYTMIPHKTTTLVLTFEGDERGMYIKEGSKYIESHGRYELIVGWIKLGSVAPICGWDFPLTV